MRYRFGTLVLMPEQRVVFDGATRIPLAPKTFDILLLLLKNAGEVVTRETLRQSVWEGAHVDEAVVSRNVSLVRVQLRPYFGEAEVVETISKRGYRFVVPVEILATAPEEKEVSDGEQITSVTGPAETAIAQGPFPLLRWTLAGALLMIVLIAVIGFRVYRSSSVHAQQNELAVLDIRDLSGDPEASWMGVALQESLSHSLSRDGGMNALDGDQVALAEEDLGLSHARKLETAELDQLDRRLGVNYLLTGTYLPVGDQVRMDLVLHSRGKVMTEFSQTVQRQDLEATIEQASARMRSALKLPPAQSSNELQYFGKDELAAHFYAEGLRLSRTGDTPRQAQEAFSKAVAADPKFAEAHDALAVAWLKVGHESDALTEAQLALGTCANLPELRRLSVQASAYRRLGNYPEALEALARLRQLKPDDQTYKLRMASTLFAARKYAEAAVLLREMEADKKHPPNLAALELLSTTLTQLGDHSARFIYAQKIMELAKAEGSRSAEAQAHLFAGMGWMSALDGTRAIDEFQQGQRLSAEIGDKVGVIAALTDETAARMTFHLPGAMEVGQRGLDLAAEIGKDGSVSAQCINLAGAAIDASQLHAALSFARRAQQLAEKAQDPSTRLVATEDLAIIYLLLEDLPNAKKSAALELQYARELGSEVDVASATKHMAEIDNYFGDWAAAGMKYQQAVASLRHVGNPPGANAVLVAYAWMLLQHGERAEAAKVLQKIDVGLLPDNEALAGYAQGRVEIASGNLAHAEEVVSKALAKDPVPYSTATGLDVLMEIALQQKDAAKAKSVAERYAALSGSIPEEATVRRGAVRAAAEAELLAGNRSGESVRKLPELLQEATRLGHAVEVAELRQVIAGSRL